MLIKEISTQQGFHSLRSIWNTLLQRSESNTIFSTFEWLYTWWEHFAQDKKLFILLAQDGENVIGIAPLMIEKKRILRYAPIKVISFIGTGVSDYADFIIVREREKVITLFFEYLKKKKWDEIELREIRENSPNLVLIQKALERLNLLSRIYVVGKCLYVETKGDWDLYYSSFSSKHRNDIHRQINRLKKNGLKYSFSFKAKELDSYQLITSLINIHLDRIAKKNKKSFLGTEEGRNFYNKMIQEFGKCGWVNLDLMYIDDVIAAYVLGFQYGGKYYHWNVGTNNKYISYAPGKLLLRYMLEEYYSVNAIEEFDFIRGEEDYKYRWTKFARKNYKITILSNSLYSKMVFKTRDSIRKLFSTRATQA